MLVLPSDPNAPDWAEEQRRTYEKLTLDFDKLAYSQALSVALTAEDRERLGNQDCASCISGQALIIGLEKEVGVRVEFPLEDLKAAGLAGKGLGPAWVRQLPSGEVVATIGLRAKGATMMRVHLTELDLPEGVELFLYSQDGEVFGPWTGTGPHKSGEFWTNTLSSPEGFLEIRGPAWGGLEHFSHARLTVRAISAIDPGAARGIDASDADKSYCGLESCFRDARCVSSSEFAPLNDAKKAIARLYFQVAGSTGLCTGQLLNTTQGLSSPYAYLLTANHCFSTAASASSLDCIWDYENSTCGGCRSISGLPRTLGATLLATSTTTDFTFVSLTGSVPSGRTLLGWDASTNVAASNGMIVHRLSHPEGLPLSYSRHQVATTGLTCSGYSRGNYIYSAQVSGAIRGGSSGSAVLNASGQVIGQLFGACSSVLTPCTYERIVDGAFQITYPSIRAWLAPTPPTNDTFPGQSISGSASLVSGTTAGATRQAGEPVHCGVSTSGTVWYSWTAPASGRAEFTTCSAASFDTVVAVYTGSAVDSLLVLACNDDGSNCPNSRSRAFFNATAGTTYRIVVAGYGVESGTFTLDWSLAACSYSISPVSRSLSSSVATGQTISVTAGAGCTWSATSDAPWITVTGGASGSGNGTVTYSVAANTTSSQRQGTITAAGQTHTVTQAGVPCNYSVSPSSRSVVFSGATDQTLSVTAVSGCNWSATTTASWISITGGSSGSGNGTVMYDVAANTAASQRQGTISVAGQVHTVTQAAAPPVLSVAPSERRVFSDEGQTSFAVSNSGTGSMAWSATVVSGGSWLRIDAGASGTNSGTIVCGYSRNTTGQVRTGTVRVSASGAQGSPMNVTVTQYPTDDAYEPNNSWQEGRQRPAIRPGDHVGNLRSFDEDWYRIVIGSEESVRIRVLFSHAGGNLNAELYDVRSLDRSGWPFRVGESYSPNHPWVWNPNAGDGPAPVWTSRPWGPATNDDEWITYVNNTGATELVLRVYGQDWESNPDYSIAVDSLGSDDQFEPNNEPHEAATIQIGTRYEGLIGKDNDFYRVNTTGRTAIRVRVACYALLGTMYFEVYRALPEGGYAPIEAGKMYEPNRYEAQRVVCVQGLSEVFVRVYPSVRMPNVYNLTVENVATCPTAKDATDEVPKSNWIPEGAWDDSAADPLAAILRWGQPLPANTLPDDSYEPNNSWHDARQRPALRPGQTATGLRSYDEDWYRIELGADESIRIRVLFTHANGNLNAELYDLRSFDRSGWPFRAGESYSPNHPWVWNPNAGDGPAPVWTTLPWGPATANDEWITYVNNSGATELFLRVYGQNWETNDNYSVAITSLGADDTHEPNNEPHQAATIQIGTRYEGLIGKDNDFYRVNTTGRTAIRVRVACYALLGTMYFEVHRKLSDGRYEPIEQSKMYEPNRYEAQRVVCVQGLSEVFVRVYPSVRMPNVYNLVVENVNTCP
ncbi:MAG: trypsin-like peptidase domain-containing protein [Candidatus Sumerlaeia bacterium]|nr:trypsin-like peptidase domain-containing protein [Candidatus Sumerlaeia bacterium]